MSQEFVGNIVGASNNVNRNATNLNLQDVIREMDRLLQLRLRLMEERIEQLEEIYLEGQLSQRRHNSECEEEYDGEIDDEQAYERATQQGLRQQEPKHQRARPRVDDNLNNIKINIPPFQGKTDPEAYLAWRSNSKERGLHPPMEVLRQSGGKALTEGVPHFQVMKEVDHPRTTNLLLNPAKERG
ncbi:hypothetical protein V6N12_062220 [Hibiscus sabdariffa]|uniref:Uncharacterized protein n=1 Tax=Hibiscus sabdariffa TaxID=183260 RepID=A0ABR2F892_9ROSI